MREHINFEAIECDDLLYMNASKSYVCMCFLYDLNSVDECMRCKFSKQKAIENAIRNAFKKSTIEKVKNAHANDRRKAKRRAYLNKCNKGCA